MLSAELMPTAACTISGVATASSGVRRCEQAIFFSLDIALNVFLTYADRRSSRDLLYH